MKLDDVFILDSILAAKERIEIFLRQNPGPYTLDVRQTGAEGLYHIKTHNPPTFEDVLAISEEYVFDDSVQFIIVAAKFNRILSIRRHRTDQVLKWQIEMPQMQLDRPDDTTTLLSEESALLNPSILAMLEKIKN